MAANAAMTILGGETPTPVSHVFSPIKADNKSAYWSNFTASSVIGRESIVLTQTSERKVRSVSVRVTKPIVVVETVNGVSKDTLLNFGTIKIEVIVPHEWTEQQVLELVTLGKNSLGDSIVLAAAKRGEGVW